MIRPVIRRRARHVKLHHALTALDETHEVQFVELPEDRSLQYYQKYAHMLAERWGMKVHTRGMPAGKRGPAMMFIQERSR